MISASSSAQCMKAYRARRDRERIAIQDQYHILGFISSGTYGKVYKAQLRVPRERQKLSSDDGADFDTSAVVAIKKFKPDREGEASYTGISQSACREIMGIFNSSTEKFDTRM